MLLLSGAALVIAGAGLYIGSFQDDSLSVSGSAGEGQEEIPLYAQAAVLMDADSGRILYSKEADRQLPMASTTKIMTLIIALENVDGQEVAQASSYASSQPKVRLGMTQGQQFCLGDLYYSLMLESHNDTAVCIAEHVGRKLAQDTEISSEEAVEVFLDKMNEKARELGCVHTCFLTPNGLDAERTEGGETFIHSTTAGELARILKYCIEESPRKEEFLSITRTPTYTFHDVEGNESYSCTNHNAFLSMMEGALTGKTGFTAKAGYCYVGALRQGERTFIVSLLACGWPNNKNYKWEDTRALMEYGLDNYEYYDVYQEDIALEPVRVDAGVPSSGVRTDTAYAQLVQESGEGSLPVLLREDEKVQVSYEGTDVLKAPVKAGEQTGDIIYRLGDWEIARYPVVVRNDVKKLDFAWCLGKVLSRYVPVV